MRKARIKVAGRGAVYHCVFRVVGGQMLLQAPEKTRLREMLWQQADFSGLEVITYCVMTNHVHLLLRVPSGGDATDADLVARATKFYGKQSPYVRSLREAIKTQGALTEELRQGLLERIGDVSAFVKELKQRFSRWFNQERNRFGTLWAERFRSVLVEDRPDVLLAVAGYVDLNPVRARLVKDPKDYAWCGYAEAVAGNPAARRGLANCHASNQWAQAEPEYRAVLLATGEAGAKVGKAALRPESLRRALKREGRLTLGQLLRLRVRYFTDGVAVGSPEYVNAVFAEYRDRFGPRRKSGARRLRGLESTADLATMRDLQVKAVG